MTSYIFNNRRGYFKESFVVKMRIFFFVIIIKKKTNKLGLRGVFGFLDMGIKEDKVLLVELFCRILLLKEESSRFSGFFNDSELQNRASTLCLS